jgi:hypothetical protein
MKNQLARIDASGCATNCRSNREERRQNSLSRARRAGLDGPMRMAYFAIADAWFEAALSPEAPIAETM